MHSRNLLLHEFHGGDGFVHLQTHAYERHFIHPSLLQHFERLIRADARTVPSPLTSNSVVLIAVFAPPLALTIVRARKSRDFSYDFFSHRPILARA